LVASFKNRFHPEWEVRARELGFSVHEIVILASIVEKESGVPSERPLVSAVFHNRLKKGWKLQSDPTTIYGLLPDFNGNLTRQDLINWSPFNTYKVKRLPLGPIANPGQDSLRAALFPAQVPYLFFVGRNDGTHHFSVSLKEHNRAVEWWQKMGKVGGTLPKKHKFRSPNRRNG